MSFAFPWRAHLPDDQVTGAQVVTSQLGLGDVYILIADAVIRRPQESDALAHDFEDPAAQFDTLLLRLRLPDHHGKGFLFHAIRVWDVQRFPQAAKLGKRFIL